MHLIHPQHLEAERRGRSITTRITTAAILGIVFMLLIGFAANAQSPAAVAPAAPPSSTDVVKQVDVHVEAAAPEPVKELSGAVQAAQKTNGGITLATILGVVIGLVRLLQMFGSKLPGQVGAFFDSPLAGWVLPAVLSFTGALATAAADPNVPLDANLIFGAIAVAIGATGFGQVAAAARAEKKAEAKQAGAVAAAAVTSDAAAAKTIDG